MKLLAELKPEEIVVVIDSREQLPFDLSPLATVRGSLDVADYALLGLEHLCRLERKTLPDLLNCCGNERPRFEREIQRMLSFPTRAVLVESNWAALETGDWQSKVTPASAIGSILGWVAMGIPFLMCDSHERAGRYCARLLYITARRRWRELRAMADQVDRQIANRNPVRPQKWKGGG